VAESIPEPPAVDDGTADMMSLGRRPRFMAEPRAVEVKVRPRLDAVTVRPGDKLVVRVPVDSTREMVEEARARLADRLPGVEVVFIGAEQLLVYRPDDSNG
jgi:hypothetical protein